MELANELFGKGDYARAERLYLEVLDMEPNNWMARYYLGICYAKNKQMFAAQRVFRLIYDKAPDQDLRKNACLMLQRTNGEIQEGGAKRPIEFGRYCGGFSRVSW